MHRDFQDVRAKYPELLLSLAQAVFPPISGNVRFREISRVDPELLDQSLPRQPLYSLILFWPFQVLLYPHWQRLVYQLLPL